MKIRIYVEGMHIEREAIQKVVDFLKTNRGLVEEVWSVSSDPSPFKTPIETPFEVQAIIQPEPSSTR